MYKLIIGYLSITLLISCGPSKEPLNTDDMVKEQNAVINVIKTYNRASQEKNFAGILPTLSQDVIFFGTDSAEVIKSLNEFKKKITDQFNSVDKMIYGEMTDQSIQMDPYGNFASIIYGIPCDVTLNGTQQHMFLRVARTLKKEDGKWVIVSGIIGVAGGTSNQQPTIVQPQPEAK